MLNIGLGPNGLARTPAAIQGGGYEAEAAALFARFTTPPSADEKTKVNRRIRKLKALNRWSKLDILRGFKAATKQAALLNWKGATYDATEFGTVTHTPGRGFAGDGTTGYRKTGFNPFSSGSENFLLNSAMMGVWARTVASGVGRVHFGGQQGSSHYTFIEASSGNILQARLNQPNPSPLQAGGGATTAGLYTAQRTASNVSQLTINTAKSATSSTASSALPNAELYEGARNSSGASLFSTDMYQLLFLGAPFATDEEWLKTYFIELDYVNDVVAWGDSLTYGAGSSGAAARYPNVAGDLFSQVRDVSNQGVGGQTSTQIAARMGAQPITVSVTSDQIPASGGVSVTAKNINVLVDSGTFTGSIYGTLAGIFGVITTDASGNWTFTRSDAGSATSCPAGSVFTPILASTFNETTAWLWLGRNGAQSGYTVAGDIAAAAAMITTGRYLVGAILTSTGDSAGNITALQALNASLASTYGSRFVDLMAILQAANDGSANDLADIAAGYTPRSLRSDAVHLNDAGYAIVAAAWKNATVAMGW